VICPRKASIPVVKENEKAVVSVAAKSNRYLAAVPEDRVVLLTNTSVLDLDVSKTIESVFVSSVQKSKGIPKTKRRLDTKYFIEVRGGDGSAGGGLLGGSESSGGGDKGGKDGGLHDDILTFKDGLGKIVSRMVGFWAADENG
jgi:hypothetical protein